MSKGTDPRSFRGDCRRTLRAHSRGLMGRESFCLGMLAWRSSVPAAHAGLWCLMQSLPSQPQAALLQPWSQRSLA